TKQGNQRQKCGATKTLLLMKTHSETGANSDSKRSGRPKATIASEDTFLRVNSLHDRWLTEQQLQAQLNSDRSKQVSVSTVKKRLQAVGLTGRDAARKPLLRCVRIRE
uniref:Transposase Tc1-like domain-containing protein n=1 Tax=Nothobranchius furzeri TaxID=105023 RepID=A0A8C6KFH0_NOTFU